MQQEKDDTTTQIKKRLQSTLIVSEFALVRAGNIVFILSSSAVFICNAVLCGSDPLWEEQLISLHCLYQQWNVLFSDLPLFACSKASSAESTGFRDLPRLGCWVAVAGCGQ